MAISGITTMITNFMSDSATVAATGPVAILIGNVGGIHLWKVGLACAFASSFANATIVGTPNNALVYAGAVAPKSGERLVSIKDFFVYGLPVTIIAWLLLSLGTVLGYWRWMSWK